MEKKQYIIPTIETAEMEMDVVMQATSALLDENNVIDSSEKIGSRELDEFIDWD